MKQSENLLVTQLEPWFSSLRTNSPRVPQATHRGRRSFLAQAEALAAPVSKLDQQRHTGWIVFLKRYFTPKEYSPMYATIASFILVLALMFGGTGTAVLAAQNSLPSQPLYQVKTFAEDLALRSTYRNTHRLQMEMDYAHRRVTEMTRLREMQQEVPEAAYQRLEQHIDQALLIAANSEDGEMIRALNQIRERLQVQISSISPDLEHDPSMIRIREMIQTRLSWTELGLDEPNEYQKQAQVRTQFNQQAQFEHQFGPGPGPDLDPEPGTGGFGLGPQESGPNYEDCHQDTCEPDPENGFGPGPEAHEGEPQQGPGDNDQHSNGEGGQGPEQPPSGEESPGPGPGSNQDQDAGNDEHGNSSNPDQQQGDGSDKGNGGKP